MNSNQVGTPNDYTYNGKEMNSDFGLNLSDYGARWYDASIGQFTTQDRFAEKYYDLSPYQYVGGNPINRIDINGDSTWVTSSSKFDEGLQKNITTYVVHVEGKVLDLSGSPMSSGADESSIASGINDFYNGSSGMWKDSNGDVHTIRYNVNFEAASSMDDVKESDHLLVVVDEVLGKADPDLGGGEAGGLAQQGGKIGYIESGNSAGMTQTGIHEFGHSMGLGHHPNGSNNVMSYDNWTVTNGSFTNDQHQDMMLNSLNGSANNGANRQQSPVTTNNYIYNTSSNEKPWYKNTTRGDVIPRILVNHPGHRHP